MSSARFARWLFHARVVEQDRDARAPYAPPSLAREGFIHASFFGDVAESARLYLPADAPLEVMQIDPRRLAARVDVAETPRGPMPHIHGPVPRDAVRAVRPLTEHLALPPTDRVTGTSFAFVAFEGMTLLDLVGVYDPLSRIRAMEVDATSRCEIVGAHAGATWARDAARLEVERVRPPLDPFDVLVLPGGPGARRLLRDDGFLAWLATYPDNRLIASVCTGALLLGAAGRLEGRRATTHASAMRELAVYGATAVSERVVDEGQVVTAGGVTSGLDLGLHLVRRLEGDAAAVRIARQMEMPATFVPE